MEHNKSFADLLDNGTEAQTTFTDETHFEGNTINESLIFNQNGLNPIKEEAADIVFAECDIEIKNEPYFDEPYFDIETQGGYGAHSNSNNTISAGSLIFKNAPSTTTTTSRNVISVQPTHYMGVSVENVTSTTGTGTRPEKVRSRPKLLYKPENFPVFVKRKDYDPSKDVMSDDSSTSSSGSGSSDSDDDDGDDSSSDDIEIIETRGNYGTSCNSFNTINTALATSTTATTSQGQLQHIIGPGQIVNMRAGGKNPKNVKKIKLDPPQIRRIEPFGPPGPPLSEIFRIEPFGPPGPPLSEICRIEPFGPPGPPLSGPATSNNAMQVHPENYMGVSVKKVTSTTGTKPKVDSRDRTELAKKENFPIFVKRKDYDPSKDIINVMSDDSSSGSGSSDSDDDSIPSSEGGSASDKSDDEMDKHGIYKVWIE